LQNDRAARLPPYLMFSGLIATDSMSVERQIVF